MSFIDSFGLSQKYTWNMKWIKPYESGWSILEKFKCANVITSRELLMEFGTTAVKKIKGKIIGRQHRDLLNFYGFNRDFVTKTLGIDMSDHTHKHLSKLIKMFPNYININQIFRNHLTYCIECLMMGYHSLLHQYKLIHFCPYHMCKLDHYCRYCGQTLSFELSTHKYTGGFFCKCSQRLVEIQYDIDFKSNFDLVIQNSTVAKWLSMDAASAHKMKNIYMILSNLENYTDAMDYLLSLTADDNKIKPIVVQYKNYGVNCL